MIPVVLWSVVIPTIAAGAIVAAGRWGPLRGRACAARTLVVVAIAVAVVWSFVASVGWPSLPPAQKWHAVPWIAVLIGVWGIFDTLLPRDEWPGRLVLAVVGGIVVGWGLVLPGVEPLTVGMVVGATGALTALMDSRGRAALPLGGWAIAAALSMLTLVAGQLTMALLAGAVSGTLAAIWLVGLCSGKCGSDTRAGGAALGATLAVIALTAWSYDYDLVPRWAWLVVAAGIPGACMLEVGSLGRWHGVLASCVRSLVLVSPAIAVVLTQIEAVKGAMRG
ncbi:MAG: hypothetical protein QF561_05235 [Phycisphaerales bacterium]|nr:hypothetical protein [Phycisphaerales bacterium]